MFVTLLAGGFALLCLLLAAVVFTLESRCTIGLLRLALPQRAHPAMDPAEG